MRIVVPDYYDQFCCLAGECTHSCCIGWEIDVDAEALSFYSGVTGPMGERLKRAIARDEQPHFILGEDERCPFLNSGGLCDLILELGEDYLCAICADHPRFRNELPGRVEVGLGLCCEAAGRLILGREEPMALVADGELNTNDRIIRLRDEVISCLQDRNRTIPERVADMLGLCGAQLPVGDMALWAGRLLELERLDEEWTRRLEELQAKWNQVDLGGFDVFMGVRQIEYEQLLVYLVYRHLANAFCDEEVSARAAFAAFGYFLVRGLGAVRWSLDGDFTFEQQVDLVRMFSAEIEYSQENTDDLLELLA